jgi:hypothetical protein
MDENWDSPTKERIFDHRSEHVPRDAEDDLVLGSQGADDLVGRNASSRGDLRQRGRVKPRVRQQSQRDVDGFATALVIRSFVTPSVAALMGKWFRWPMRLRERPVPSPWPSRDAAAPENDRVGQTFQRMT